LSRTKDLGKPSPPTARWLREAGRRIHLHWVFKMVGTTICMTSFFVAYFWLLDHSRLPSTTVPRIFIDDLVPFQPLALPLYVSIWIYVPLAPALMRERRELWSYAVAVLVVSLVGFAVFLLWPTTVPKPDIDWAQHPSVSYLKAVDASGNAFPSLHVAFAVFTAVWFHRLLRQMGAGAGVLALNWLWCLGIIYSTLAIRQHVALDAIAGVVLGAAGAFAHLRFLGALHPGAEAV
jgi:membrane-associated phospholipid phosphatase